MMNLVKRIVEWLAAVVRAAMPTPVVHEGIRIPVELPGLSVVAREMSVIEVRNWLKAQRSAKDFDWVDRMLFAEQGVTIDELVRMSTATRTELERFVPSDLVKLADAVKQANPFFFQLRSRLINLERASANS